MYAHVKDDGSVDYLGALPKSWGNVSNLHLSNGDEDSWVAPAGGDKCHSYC